MLYKLIIIIFAFVGYDPIAFAESCSVTLDALARLQQGTDAIDAIETPPFIMACKETPTLLRNRPKTALAIRSVVEKDSQGRTTRDLLKRVIAKVRKRVIETSFQIQNIEKCMSSFMPECAEIKKWVDTDLPENIKQARYHLSLSQSQHEVKTMLSMAAHSVNQDLDPIGSYKLNDWDPLTHDEFERANKKLSHYINEIKTEAQKQWENKQICLTCRNQFSEDALITVRYQHFQIYHQMLSELPIMQYLSEPNVKSSNLLSAFTKMQEDLNHETQQLNEYERMLTESPLPTDILKILNYSSQLEETLLEDNRDCGLATSLVYTMSNRQLGNSIAIGLPILIVSFYAMPVIVSLGGTVAIGAAASITTGVAAGGAFAFKSYQEFRDTQKRTMGYIYGDSLGADLRNLEGSLKRTKYDVVTLPIGFGLGGLALRSLSVGYKSLTAGRKIFEAANP